MILKPFPRVVYCWTPAEWNSTSMTLVDELYTPSAKSIGHSMVSSWPYSSLITTLSAGQSPLMSKSNNLTIFQKTSITSVTTPNVILDIKCNSNRKCIKKYIICNINRKCYKTFTQNLINTNKIFAYTRRNNSKSRDP